MIQSDDAQAAPRLQELPVELANIPSGAEVGRREESDTATSAEPMLTGPRGLRDFLWKVHAYTNEYIRFSDTKSGVVVAFSLTVLGALGATKHFNPLGSVSVGGWSTINWATGGAALLLVTATLSAAWSMRPRLWNPQSKGFIFWESIKAHETAADFKSSLAQQSEADLNTHLAGHLHVLAAVASRKYFWSDVAMLLAAAGGFVAAAVLIFA